MYVYLHQAEDNLFVSLYGTMINEWTQFLLIKYDNHRIDDESNFQSVDHILSLEWNHSRGYALLGSLSISQNVSK